MTTLRERAKNLWNAFANEDEKNRVMSYGDYGASYSTRPDQQRRTYSTNEKSIVSAVYNRMAIDVASVDIRHARLDEDGRFSDTIDSGLNTCLTLEANMDQGARAFKQDMVSSLFDRGVIAITPIDTDLNPDLGSFDIKTMRVGHIVTWYPSDVTISVYNEAIGERQDITVPKSRVAIPINPLYAVMNDHNSTFQRLVRKLNLLDAIDEQSASGKLDLIIQLPYVIKSEARKQQAQARKGDLEEQLKDSKYGIGYVDATEKITQLNRPAENNLLAQVEYLTEMVYGQLGLTPEIMNGTASEEIMLNYYNRTIEPILTEITESMRRVFLTKTARTQGQTVMFFRNPFKLIPISQMAELGDKFSRNEILTGNEIRQLIGFKPSKDKKADQLINKNIPVADPLLEVKPPKPKLELEAPAEPIEK